MRNISQDVIEVINFYRSLVMGLADKSADIEEIFNRKHIFSQALKEECEYLKAILERED